MRRLMLLALLTAGCSSAPPTHDQQTYQLAFKHCNRAFFGTNIVNYYGYRPIDFCKMYAQRAKDHRPMPRLP